MKKVTREALALAIREGLKVIKHHHGARHDIVEFENESGITKTMILTRSDLSGRNRRNEIAKFRRFAKEKGSDRL